MKVPKDSAELIKEIDATIDWRNGEYDMRDIVRLLDERFAFAGEVKLSKNDAEALAQFLRQIYDDTYEVSQVAKNFMESIQSKLSEDKGDE